MLDYRERLIEQLLELNHEITELAEAIRRAGKQILKLKRIRKNSA